MDKNFKVGVTSDIIDSRGEPAFGREPLKALEGVPVGMVAARAA